MSVDRSPSARVLGRGRAVRRGVLLLAETAALMGTGIVARRVAPDRAKAQVWSAFQRTWAGSLMRTFGIEVILDAPLPAPPVGGRLVVANHRSPVDVLLVLSLFGGRVLSRADLRDWPVLGRAAREAGTIFVDRGKGSSGAAAIRAIRRALAAGETVSVFPEGTTAAGDAILPLSRGAFAAASGLRTDVLPMAVAYPPGTEFTEPSFVDHLLRVAERPRLRIGVAVGAPRPPEPTSAACAARATQELEALVLRARATLK